MKKTLLIIITLITVIINSCSNINVGCQKDLKICDDGTKLSRISPNCEFPKCQNENNEKEFCEMANGEWKSFPNTCVDSCSYIRSKERIMCGQAFTDGCDCGPDKCWNGKSCENN